MNQLTLEFNGRVRNRGQITSLQHCCKNAMVGCRVQNSCLMHLPTIMQNRERYVLKLCRPFAILLNHTLPDNEYDRNFWEKTIKFIFPFFKWLGCSANQPRLFFLAPLDWQEPQPEGGLPQVPSSPRLHPSMRRGCQAAAVETWRSSGHPSSQKQSGSYYRWVLFLTKMN